MPRNGSKASTGNRGGERSQQIASLRFSIPTKRSPDKRQQFAAVALKHDAVQQPKLLSIPTEIVERIVDAALSGEKNGYYIQDRCGSKYTNIALINRQFFDAYLRFFGQFSCLNYCTPALGPSEPNIVQLTKLGSVPYNQWDHLEYIVPRGLVKLLAQQGKLTGLKIVRIRLGAKQLRVIDCKTPLECLLQLLGIDSQHSTNVINKLHLHKGDGCTLALDYAHVEYRGVDYNKVELALGLNASQLEIHLCNHILPGQLLGFPTPTAHFNRITELRLEMPPAHLPQNLPLSKRLRHGGAQSTASHHEVDPFPGDVTLMERLVSVCNALKVFHVKYVFTGSNSVDNKSLTRYRNAICALYDAVMASEQLRSASASIEIVMLHVLWGAEKWPLATLQHPLFQLGANTNKRTINYAIYSSEITREMVFDKDETSGRTENNGDSRKVLVWSASCAVSDICL